MLMMKFAVSTTQAVKLQGEIGIRSKAGFTDDNHAVEILPHNVLDQVSGTFLLETRQPLNPAFLIEPSKKPARQPTNLCLFEQTLFPKAVLRLGYQGF